MTTYIVRRMLWGIVLLLLVSALTFIFFNVLPVGRPGRAARRAQREPRRSSPTSAHELGLDKPVYTQFSTT